MADHARTPHEPPRPGANEVSLHLEPLFLIVGEGTGGRRVAGKGIALARETLRVAHKPFLHPGVPLRIELPSVEGLTVPLAATVEECVYDGDGHHVSTCSLAAPVRLERFVCSREIPPHLASVEQSNLEGDVCILAETDLDTDALRVALSRAHIPVVGFTAQDPLLDHVKRQATGVVFLVITALTEGHDALIALVRATGFAGPIIALAESPAVPWPGDPHAVDAVMTLPLDPVLLGTRLHDMLDKRAAADGGDPAACLLDLSNAEQRELVTAYLTKCSGIVDALFDAVHAADIPAARTNLNAIARTADTFGYPALGTAAREALRQLNATESPAESAAMIGAVRRIARAILVRMGIAQPAAQSSAAQTNAAHAANPPAATPPAGSNAASTGPASASAAA